MQGTETDRNTGARPPLAAHVPAPYRGLDRGDRWMGHRILAGQILVMAGLAAGLAMAARAEAPPPPVADAPPPPPSAAEQLGTIRLEPEVRQQTFGATEVPVDHLRPRRRGNPLPSVPLENGVIFQPEVGPDTIQPGVEFKGMFRMDLDR